MSSFGCKKLAYHSLWSIAYGPQVLEYLLPGNFQSRIDNQGQVGLSAGEKCWYKPDSSIESLMSAKLACQQEHSTGLLPGRFEINNLRPEILSQAFGTMDSEELWLDSDPMSACHKWYFYNVMDDQTDCLSKHSVLCVKPPADFRQGVRENSHIGVTAESTLTLSISVFFQNFIRQVIFLEQTTVIVFFLTLIRSQLQRFGSI